MTAVPVKITIRPASTVVDNDEIELVDDLDSLVESSKCSTNAGDDNPY